MDARGIRRIRKLLDWLEGIGVDSVAVSTPYLAEIVKKRYPNFFLKIGIYANIDSPDRARYWEGMGAGMLVLESFSINRNFAVLAAIRKAVSCRLQLITNFTCLSRCPMQPYHMTGLSHGSSSSDNAAFVDYCVFKCTYWLLKDPSQLIKSQWIRPEDIPECKKIWLAASVSFFFFGRARALFGNRATLWSSTICSGPEFPIVYVRC
ncbi:MAG: U32 family peptidase [Candidatus Omnitrophica bacterium]|nr:U32 family peptidase [Candidatus Omnitrophota bacterium]